MNEEFNNRREFIKKNNELNKKANVQTFIEGNKKKVALDQRLEELSINSGVLVSGNVVRNNVLNSSASHVTTVNNVVSTEVFDDENKEKTDEIKKRLHIDINVGKEIAEKIKNNSDSKNNTNIVNKNI